MLQSSQITQWRRRAERYQQSLAHKRLLILTPLFPDRSNAFPGGSFVKNQIEPLKDYFKEITVIAPVLASFGIAENDRLCRNYTYNNIRVYFPRCLYLPHAYYPPFLFKKINLDNRLEVVQDTIRRRNIQFDIIHAHFSWPSTYIGAVLKEKHSVPLVATIHENAGWLQEELAMDHPLLRHAWKDANVLIRVNRKDIASLKKFNRNTISVPNGHTPQFKPMDTLSCRAQLDLEPDTRILFSLGGLIERKGFYYLIQAMRAISDARGDVQCYIGGSGPIQNRLQGEIDRLNLGDRVRLVGFIPDSLLPVWMNAADMFVLPSLSEGNPTVMFEALACGKPFIGTDVGGVPEIITSEAYGLLCSPADARGLTRIVSSALDRRWDSDAIRQYANQFSWDHIAETLAGIYRSLLNT